MSWFSNSTHGFLESTKRLRINAVCSEEFSMNRRDLVIENKEYMNQLSIDLFLEIFRFLPQKKKLLFSKRVLNKANRNEVDAILKALVLSNSNCNATGTTSKNLTKDLGVTVKDLNRYACAAVNSLGWGQLDFCSYPTLLWFMGLGFSFKSNEHEFILDPDHYLREVFPTLDKEVQLSLGNLILNYFIFLEDDYSNKENLRNYFAK